jgi:hypothetical protein
MIKKIALLGFFIFSHIACVSNEQFIIAPSFTEHNRTNGYFMEPVIATTSTDMAEALDKEWFYSKTMKRGLDIVNVNSCSSLIDLTSSGYFATENSKQGMFDAKHTVCMTWQIMADFKASKQSFLGDIEFNKAFADITPPQLALVISRDDERRLAKAANWEDMSQIKSVEKLNNEQAIFVDSTGGKQKITLMAKGDYNGDGIEDVLFYMENSVEGGSYSSVYAYVLTRLSSGVPFTLLNQW